MADHHRRSKNKQVKTQQIILNNKKLEEDYVKEYGGVKLETTVPNPTRVTFSLIAKRNLPLHLANGPQDKLIESLVKISHVRLDRENIQHIDNLEMLGPVTNLYLQKNLIQRIENLESLRHLRFLVLSGNGIHRVENMRCMESLKFLDLSDNLISQLDIDELPSSLMILNLSGNECTQQSNYRSNVIKSLPNLQQLDNIEISKHERREVGVEVASSEEEEEEEEEEIQGYHGYRFNNKGLLDHSNDLFTTSSQIIQRSKDRMKDYNKKHDDILDELETFRSQSELSMNTARSNTTT